MLLVVVGVHTEVVEGKLLPDALLEGLALLQSQAVGLCDDGHNVDNVAKLAQDDNINGLQGVAGRLDKEETAMDASVLDVALALGGELLVQVCAVLVLDVFDNWLPAALVVDQVAIARSVDNVEAQAHAIFLDNVRDGGDLGGGADGLLGRDTTFGLEKVRGEESVDESGFAKAGLTYQQALVVIADAQERLERSGSYQHR